MKSRLFRLYAAPAITGLMLTLCQALPWKVDLGFIAWVALVPLVLVLRRATQGERFVMGVVAGGVHFLTALYWLVGTLHTYGNLNLIGSFFAALLLVALETAYVTLFALIFGLFADRVPRLPTAALLPFLWIGTEFLRARTPFGGFPWALLGYSQGGYTTIVQIADLTGVWGATFLLALVNGMFVDVIEWRIQQDRPAPWGSVAAAALLFIFSLIYGAWRVREVEARNKTATPLVAAALQGDIRQDVKWDENYENMIISRYIELQHKAIRAGARLVVWPEAATPFAFERDMAGLVLSRHLASSGVYTLLGSVDYYVEDNRRKFSNSAYLVGPEGVAGKYSKIHLVPFGEYLPLVKYLGFVDKIVKGATGNFSTGGKVEVFRLPEGSISVIICYEAIFGELVRKFRKAGAQLIVNITNDAWFGDTSAPRQHLAMAAFRCVENHCWMVRAANTGLSAIVDPLGRVTDTADVLTMGMLVKEVRLLPGGTPYSEWGDLFLYCVLLGCVAGIIWITIVKREKGISDETGN